MLSCCWATYHSTLFIMHVTALLIWHVVIHVYQVTNRVTVHSSIGHLICMYDNMLKWRAVCHHILI